MTKNVFRVLKQRIDFKQPETETQRNLDYNILDIVETKINVTQYDQFRDLILLNSSGIPHEIRNLLYRIHNKIKVHLKKDTSILASSNIEDFNMGLLPPQFFAWFEF